MIMGVLFIIAFSSAAYAANTIVIEGKIYKITIVDADWSWETTLPAAGVRLHSIQYTPAATDEICVIEEGSDAGPHLFYVKCADVYDQRIKYFGDGLYRPYFDYSDSTGSAGGIITIILR